MITNEERVRRLGAAVTPPDLPSAAELMRRGQQRRQHRRRARVVAVALLAASGGLALLHLGAGDSSTDVRTATPEDRNDGGATTTPAPDASIPVPNVVGLTADKASAIIEDLGLTVEVSVAAGTDGSEVLAQEPVAPADLPVGGTVILNLGDLPDLERPANVDGPVIRGTLLDGRTWTVGFSSRHGLCVTIGSSDFGCDDVGPVISPDADPGTPRTAVETAGNLYPTNEAGLLKHAFLPSGAETV